MKKIIITVSIIIVLLSSCDNIVRQYYNDGSRKSEYYMLNDKIDGIYKEYYETTGELKIIARYKLGLLEGEKRIFYKNGKVKSIENYSSNMLNGDCRYFYSNGKLECIKNYILINPKFYEGCDLSTYYNYIKEVFTDSVTGKKSQLNAVLKLNSKGQVDKLKSHYFEVALKSDTINYIDSVRAVLVFGYRRDGEKTKFRVIQFANEKMDLYNVYDSDYENVFFQDKPVRKGVNHLRGWIEEYTPYGFDTLRNVFFFDKKYFVK